MIYCNSITGNSLKSSWCYIPHHYNDLAVTVLSSTSHCNYAYNCLLLDLLHLALSTLADCNHSVWQPVARTNSQNMIGTNRNDFTKKGTSHYSTDPLDYCA